MVTMQVIHTLLQRVNFPARKDDIIEQMRGMDAPEAVIDRLRQLPENYYGSTDSVMDALRGQE